MHTLMNSCSSLFSRVDLVPVSGHSHHAETKHVLYGPPAGEGGVRDVLFGSSALPQLLLALSHRLLPLGESVPHVLQVCVLYCVLTLERRFPVTECRLCVYLAFSGSITPALPC